MGCSAAANRRRADKEVGFAFRNGSTRKFTGRSLLLTFSVPQFFFHVTTAYDILRHCGVDLVKKDFLCGQGRPTELDFAIVVANHIRCGGASGHFTLERLKSPSRLALANVNQPCGRIR